jgi:hypothetical protein
MLDPRMKRLLRSPIDANIGQLELGARMRIQNFCVTLAVASAFASPAWADDFCANLKTALASVETDFTSIPGPPDDVIPGWRDAELSLPFASDCYVDTDKRDISYFCSWQKEQPAAVAARYRFLVQQTDQCLTGFQKTTGDRVTTWHDAVGTVTVDSRKVMKNTQLDAVRLTVKR